MADELTTTTDPAPGQQDTPPAGGGGESWVTDFVPETYRDAGFVTKYQNRDDFFKGVEGLSKLAGQKGLVALGEDATDEQRAAFNAQLRELTGVPGSVDEYRAALQMPDIEEGALLPQFIELAHKEGIAPGALQSVINGLNDLVAADSKAAATARTEAAKKEMTALEKEWGDEFDFKKNVAERMASEFSDETLKLLEAANWTNKASLVRDLYRFGVDYLSEGKLVDISRSPGGQLSKEDLKRMMQDPRYRDEDKRDDAFVKKIRDGFKALHNEE